MNQGYTITSGGTSESASLSGSPVSTFTVLNPCLPLWLDVYRGILCTSQCIGGMTVSMAVSQVLIFM